MNRGSFTALGVSLLCVAITSIAGGCGSTKSDAFPDPDVPGRATNPEGVPYPTANIGGHARMGTVPGNTIPNFTFQGYPSSNRAGGLTTISLADYYDPTAAHHKLLQISAAATWCSNCVVESDTLVMLGPMLRSAGAVFLTAMVEGPSPGTGPSLGDLDAWVDANHTTFDIVIDSEARRLGTVQESGVPWNALIDTRTMEILQSSSGAPDDEAAYIRLGIALASQHP